jgi:hypothetical protein
MGTMKRKFYIGRLEGKGIGVEARLKAPQICFWKWVATIKESQVIATHSCAFSKIKTFGDVAIC